jgi:hypothetical protein
MRNVYKYLAGKPEGKRNYSEDQTVDGSAAMKFFLLEDVYLSLPLKKVPLRCTMGLCEGNCNRIIEAMY